MGISLNFLQIYNNKLYENTDKSIEAEWSLYVSVNQTSFVQIIACRLVGTNPLSKPMLEYC